MRFSGLELARRLEAAEAANDAECTAAQEGTSVEALAGGWAIFAGAASPLTRCIGAGLGSRVGRAGVDELERFFHSRGARAAIDFCPLADAGMLEELRRRGYRPAEFNNALVRELAPGRLRTPGADGRQVGGVGPLRESGAGGTQVGSVGPVREPGAGGPQVGDSRPVGELAPDGLWTPDPRVRRAARDEADLWARTVGCGFFETDHLAPEEMEVGRAILRMGRAECWLALTEYGEAAGGAALSVRDGLGLLFADSTLTRHRRRGLHAALIAARLDSAARQGCDLASAGTQPGGASQRNYERMGFRVAYTKVLLVEE